MSKKVKVAFLLNNISNGGIEHFYLNYLEHTSQLEKFEFYLIYTDQCNLDIQKRFFDFHFQIIKTKNPLYKNQLKYFFELFSIFKRYRFDVIHCNLNHSNFYPLLVGKIFGIKIRIAHSHMNMSNSVLTVSLNKIQKLIRRLKIHLSDLLATKRIACSSLAGDTAFKHSYCIIYNAVDLKRFSYNEFSRKKLREQLMIGKSHLYGFFGRMLDEKNPEFAYRVFEEVKKSDLSAKFLFIGAGSQKQRMLEIFQNSSFSNDIIYIESVNHIENYYQAIDLLLFPSVSEGLGMVAIEAQLSGVPVLASDRIPKDTVISNYISFCSLDDHKMIWAERCLQLVQQAHDKVIFNEQVKKFDITLNADKLFDLYLEK